MMYLRLGMAVAALLSFVAVGFFIYDVGKQHERIKSMKAAIEILRERKLSDAEISEMSDDDLCIELTGVRCDGTDE